MKINSIFLLLLPDEIIREIFSRLPVDLVLQCKLVCKNWRDLIDDDHGSRSNNNSNIVEMGGFLLRRHSKQRGFYYGEYDDDNKVTSCFNLTKKPVFNHYHQCPFEDMTRLRRKWYIVGSCNGLIWHGEHDSFSRVNDHDDMYVSNPYTGEYAKLPPLNYHPKVYIDTFYGFGYHPTTKEYKLIRICFRLKSSVGKGHVQVYTLGSGTPWRSIGEIEQELYRFRIYRLKSGNSSWGILLNGVLYWLHENNENRKLIFSFDLEDEEFGFIQSALPVFCGFNALGVLSGCLCLSGSVEDSMHVWIMNHNDYSWSKKFVISWNQYRFCFPQAVKFCCTKVPIESSGQVLLYQGSHRIVSYDPETERFVKLRRKTEMFDVIPYMKSSISLKALGEKEVIQVKGQEQKEEKAGNRGGGAAAEENKKKKKIRGHSDVRIGTDFIFIPKHS